ncbi:MAG: hypothetical protein H6750_04615 [Nitrospiraceae bacterium]|nr:hypothetical protein [Nitrospira sp.]MCA9456123.1 hypothetical protein [Nitrospira sp.]MCB9773590.1 hypothetical protein [Nitrospiraceae bacterium]HQU28011.1 hypothetical protein [Nitrospirales bacterium]
MITSNANSQPSRVSDADILKLADDAESLRRAYERTPALQEEFLDFGCFQAYLTGLKNGRSSVCDGRGVVRSSIAESKTFLAN